MLYPESMRRLRKSEVEELLDSYDAHPLDSLSTAIGQIMGTTFVSWQMAVASLPYDEKKKNELTKNLTQALDQLLKHLVEERTL